MKNRQWLPSICIDFSGTQIQSLLPANAGPCAILFKQGVENSVRRLQAPEVTPDLFTCESGRDGVIRVSLDPEGFPRFIADDKRAGIRTIHGAGGDFFHEAEIPSGIGFFQGKSTISGFAFRVKIALEWGTLIRPNKLAPATQHRGHM